MTFDTLFISRKCGAGRLEILTSRIDVPKVNYAHMLEFSARGGPAELPESRKGARNIWHRKKVAQDITPAR